MPQRRFGRVPLLVKFLRIIVSFTLKTLWRPCPDRISVSSAIFQSWITSCKWSWIFFLARARCLSAGLRYLRLTRLPRHDRGPVPGGNRSAASCLCTVLRPCKWSWIRLKALARALWLTLRTKKLVLDYRLLPNIHLICCTNQTNSLKISFSGQLNVLFQCQRDSSDCWCCITLAFHFQPYLASRGWWRWGLLCHLPFQYQHVQGFSIQGNCKAGWCASHTFESSTFHHEVTLSFQNVSHHPASQCIIICSLSSCRNLPNNQSRFQNRQYVSSPRRMQRKTASCSIYSNVWGVSLLLHDQKASLTSKLATMFSFSRLSKKNCWQNSGNDTARRWTKRLLFQVPKKFASTTQTFVSWSKRIFKPQSLWGSLTWRIHSVVPRGCWLVISNTLLFADHQNRAVCLSILLRSSRSRCIMAASVFEALASPVSFPLADLWIEAGWKLKIERRSVKQGREGGL